MEVHAKSCGRRLRKAWISRRNNPLAGRLNSFSRNYSVETTELNPNSADGLAGTEPSACRADILVCRFTELSSSVSGDWKVARTGRLESLPHTTDSVPTSEFGLNPNSAVEMGSARLRRASSGVVPELSPHHLPSICGGKKFAGRSFRRDAENHTPEACAPRDFGLRSISNAEFGLSGRDARHAEKTASRPTSAGLPNGDCLEPTPTNSSLCVLHSAIPRQRFSLQSFFGLRWRVQRDNAFGPPTALPKRRGAALPAAVQTLLVRLAAKRLKRRGAEDTKVSPKPSLRICACFAPLRLTYFATNRVSGIQNTSILAPPRYVWAVGWTIPTGWMRIGLETDSMP
jgi:hypothetical protein